MCFVVFFRTTDKKYIDRKIKSRKLNKMQKWKRAKTEWIGVEQFMTENHVIQEEKNI